MGSSRETGVPEHMSQRALSPQGSTSCTQMGAAGPFTPSPSRSTQERIGRNMEGRNAFDRLFLNQQVMEEGPYMEASPSDFRLPPPSTNISPGKFLQNALTDFFPRRHQAHSSMMAHSGGPEGAEADIENRPSLPSPTSPQGESSHARRPLLPTPLQMQENTKRQREERKRQKREETLRLRKRKEIDALERRVAEATRRLERAKETETVSNARAEGTGSRGSYCKHIKAGWLSNIHHTCKRLGSLWAGVRFLREWWFAGARPLKDLAATTVLHWYSDTRYLVLKPAYAALCNDAADLSTFRAGKWHGSCGFVERHPRFIEKMKAHFRLMRSKGLVVNSAVMSREFQHHARLDGILDAEPMTFSRPWCRRFARIHMGWAMRKATGAAQKLPANWEEVKADFVQRACAVFQVEVKDLAFVVNSDHTGIELVPSGDYTYEEEGAEEVLVTGKEDKRQITGLVGAAADGTMLPLQLIYKGTSDRCLPSEDCMKEAKKEGFHFTFSEKHWANDWTSKQYFELVLDLWYERRCRELGKHYGVQKLLVVLDCWAVHISTSFRRWVEDHFPYMRLLFVPPYMTGKAQPADTGLNKPFKDAIKDSFQAWMADQLRANPDVDKIPLGMKTLKGPSLEWILNSWTALRDRPHVVQGAWRKAGLDKLSDEKYLEEVVAEAMRVGSQVLQLPEYEPEETVELEMAVDIADMDPEDRLEEEAAWQAQEERSTAAPPEVDVAMLRMAKQALDAQIDLLPKRGKAPPKRAKVRHRGRGVQFEEDTQDQRNVVAELNEDAAAPRGTQESVAGTPRSTEGAE